MEAKRTILTAEEREVLILAASRHRGRHLSNTEICEHIGISLDRVKTLIRQACAKLEAHNRYEAIFFAMRRGEIRLNEFYSLDELAEFWNSLYPDILERIIQLVHQGHWHLCENDEQIMRMERRQDTILTKSQRDVLILVGRGLTNREIADKLYISTSAVRTYLYRAFTKLGTHNRADAAMLALKRGEINIGDMYSLNEFIEAIAPMGIECLEKIVQLLDQKLRQDPVPARC